MVVRGRPTSDEIAALLAALATRSPAAEDPYERWRRDRIAARSGRDRIAARSRRANLR
jgi:hypothetical protein